MQTLRIIQGDSITIPIINRLSNGSRLDITGYKFYFTIKKIYDNELTDNSAILKKEWTTHSNATLGETVLNVPALDTNLVSGLYIADIQWKSPTGQIKTPAIFNLKVERAVTNRTI